MTSHLTDIELFSLVKTGSLESFTELYVRYWEELYVYAYKILRNKDHVEDVVQELFLHVWDKREAMNIESSVKAYLFKSLRNRIYNFLKANAVKHAHYQVLLNSIHQTEEGESPLEKKEYRKLLFRQLETLPYKMREVAKLYLFEDLNIKEISRILSLSEHTVRNQLNNARRRLQGK